jgi:hypothetical protein
MPSAGVVANETVCIEAGAQGIVEDSEVFDRSIGGKVRGRFIRFLANPLSEVIASLNSNVATRTLYLDIAIFSQVIS